MKQVTPEELMAYMSECCWSGDFDYEDMLIGLRKLLKESPGGVVLKDTVAMGE